MSYSMSLEEVDVDGAIQETASKVDPHTRASFLRKAGLGIGMIAGSGAILGSLPSIASAAASSDVAILNFALTLEYLESAFYSEAVMKGALSGETKTFATVVAGHEAAHVASLKGALGSSAVAKPSFDFKGTTSNQPMFQATSEVLEYTGVSAYLGQVGPTSARWGTSSPRPSSEPQGRSSQSRRGTPPGSPTSAAAERRPTRLLWRSRKANR
jgi:hypothetical protein